jgi:radical SAM superfamily enzyme
MVSLPRTCPHCDASINHYGACTCAESELSQIDAERKQIALRLDQLKEQEKRAVRRRLVELGVVQ